MVSAVADGFDWSEKVPDSYSTSEYRDPFTLPVDFPERTGVNRHEQARALRNLVSVGLISVERRGRKKPPRITLIGAKKRG